MKLNLSIISLLLFLTTSISHADDYVWGEEFKEGDVISAATFNQIFDTKTPVKLTLPGNRIFGRAKRQNCCSAQRFRVLNHRIPTFSIIS